MYLYTMYTCITDAGLSLNPPQLCPVLLDGTVLCWGEADTGIDMAANMPASLSDPSRAGVVKIFDQTKLRSSHAHPEVHACPAGHAGTTFETCAPCAAGKYAPHDNMRECAPCPAGLYSVQNENKISNVQASQLTISDSIIQDIEHFPVSHGPSLHGGRGLSAYYPALTPETMRTYSSVWDDAQAGMYFAKIFLYSCIRMFRICYVRPACPLL